MLLIQSIVPGISIHALREEGDAETALGRGEALLDFYPRPPRGGRPYGDKTYFDVNLFLSTPSARRATDGISG